MKRALMVCLGLAVTAACANNVTPTPSSDVARTPLSIPADLKAELGADIIKRLAEDQHLAAAPSARPAAFGYSYAYQGKDFSSKTKADYERLPERGFVLEREHYTEADGYLKTSTIYYAAAGLLRLLETDQTTNKGVTSPGILRLTRYRISGDLFPVSVGNEFQIDLTLSGDIQLRLQHDCEVKRELPAENIDSALSGRAFHVLCGVKIADAPPGGQDYFYIEELDFFLPNFRPSDCSPCSNYRLTVN